MAERQVKVRFVGNIGEVIVDGCPFHFGSKAIKEIVWGLEVIKSGQRRGSELMEALKEKGFEKPEEFLKGMFGLGAVEIEVLELPGASGEKEEECVYGLSGNGGYLLSECRSYLDRAESLYS